jgi:predicted MFS family arabinose efflux permease
MKHLIVKGITVVALVAALALPLASPAFAASPGTQGQPNQSCQAQPSSPGQASGAPGSAFNTGGQAGTVYAGQQPQNSSNPKSVSQYDVACFQVSSH